MSLCALSGGQMEATYLETVKKHTHGERGRRGCDSIVSAFGALAVIMERTRADILGDVFQGAIARGEASQFLTPEPVCEAMARLTLEFADDSDGVSKKRCATPVADRGGCCLPPPRFVPDLSSLGRTSICAACT